MTLLCSHKLAIPIPTSFKVELAKLTDNATSAKTKLRNEE